MCVWFATRQQSRRLEEQRAENRRDFERAVSKIYKFNRITLALAEMGYFEGYNFKWDSADASEPDNHALVGVVYEDGQYDSRIFCEVSFLRTSYSDSATDSAIGWCVFSSSAETFGRNPPTVPQRNKHSLEVKIGDPDWQCWPRLWAAFQAAAVSQLRFIHIELVTTCETTIDAATRQIEENGYGPTKTVTAIKMRPKIVLPNAPNWAIGPQWQ